MYHTATTPLADHTILSVNDSMEYFPPDIPQNITCNEHDGDFNFFCKTHQQIICVECVRLDHTNCDDIVTLSFAAKNTTSSFRFEKLDSNAQDLSSKVEQVLSDLVNMSKRIEHEDTRIKTAITDTFKGIPTDNEVMKTILNDLNLKYEKCNTEIEKNVKEMEKIKTKLSKINIKLYQVKEYCSERKAFMFMHSIVKDVVEAGKTFRQRLSDIKTVSLHCEPVQGENIHIQGNRIESLKIVLNTIPYSFDSEKRDDKNKQAQVPIFVSNIDKIGLSMAFAFPFKSGHISSKNCVCLKEKVIISNNNHTSLLLYNIDGSFDREIDLIKGHRIDYTYHSDSVFVIIDVTVINENCVAVLRKRDILIVNIENNVIELFRNLNLNPPCVRFSYSKELLYMFLSDFSITVLDMTGTIVNFINFIIDVKGIISFVVQANKIFCLSEVASCFDLNGELLWQATINNGEPKVDLQITADNLGNCYIPSDVDKNIIVISNDGKQQKLLFPRSQSIRYPRAVYFDKKNNRLIVLTFNDLCKIFNVTLKE